MSELLIDQVEDRVLNSLQNRATRHGRTVIEEAREILVSAVTESANDPWSEIDSLREELQETQPAFEDSTPLIREDRHR